LNNHGFQACSHATDFSSRLPTFFDWGGERSINHPH